LYLQCKTFSRANYATGLSVTERINVTFTLGSPQDYTRFHQAIAAPIHAILANETQERKEEIWDAVTAEITRSYGNNSTGSVSIDNNAICVSGTK
jgi:enediyne biosynthesis protein CalE5